MNDDVRWMGIVRKINDKLEAIIKLGICIGGFIEWKRVS